MPTNFRPGVLPDDEPRRRYGDEIGNAFNEFIRNRETIEAGDRAEAREGRASEAHDFGMERDRFRFRGEVEDEGYVPADRYDRTGRGTQPGQDVQGAPGVRRPDVEGDAGRFDPGRDPFEDQDVGMAAEFDRFREAGPQAMREPVLLPGQFNPATGFAPTAVFMPETGQAPPQGQVRPGGPIERRDPRQGQRAEIGGQEYVRDPSQSQGARERRRTEEAFQEEVDRLIQAGVPEDQAPAVAEQGLAGQFVRPEGQQSGEIEYTYQELVDAGVEPGAARAAMRDPTLARQLINEAHRRISGGRGRDDQPEDFDAALEIINEEYGQYDEEGYLVGYHLSPRERFRLAEQLAAGELRPEDLPEMQAEGEAPPMEEEDEGGGAWQWITDAFTGAREGAAQEPEPGLTYDRLPEESQGRVDTAVRDIQEVYPNAGEELLREKMSEAGYSPGEIEVILERR